MTASKRAPAIAALLVWRRYEQRLGAGVSTTAGDLLGVLASYVNRDGEAWPSVPTLAADTDSSVRTVQRALAEILEHPRPPLARTLGGQHASALYVVTDHAYAAIERRGIYARVHDAPEVIPKAPGGAEAEVPAGSAAEDPGTLSGVTPMTPLAGDGGPLGTPVAGGADNASGAPVETGPPEASGVTSMTPLAADRASGVTPMTPLGTDRASGVTPMTPLTADRAADQASGVTSVTLRGDKFDARIRKKYPLNGDSKTTITAAAAGAASRQAEQQQQRQLPGAQDLTEARDLIDGIVRARGERLARGEPDLKALTPAAVLAEASTFKPAGERRVVTAVRLEGMSPEYLARTLIALREWHARERQAAGLSAGGAPDEHPPREDLDAQLEALACQPERAAETWALIAEGLRARVDGYRWATWVRPLEGIDLRGGRLLVACPTPQGAKWAEAHAADIEAASAAAGLTCQVEVLPRAALVARLALEAAAEAAAGGRGPPARVAVGRR